MASQARFSTSWVRERVERASTAIERVWTRYASVRHFVVTLLIFAVAQGVHHVVVDRPFGEAFRNLEYSIIQRVLVSEFATTTSVVSNDKRLPVVIDISPAAGDRSLPTNRKMLATLVHTLKTMGATAIGVDIDFSPDDSGRFMDERDPALLAGWNEDRIVRVGVFRRIGDSSRYWLGYPALRRLAAGIMLPVNDSMFAYQYTSPDLATSRDRVPLNGSWGDDPDEQLIQMPTALYAVIRLSDRTDLVNDPRVKTEEVEGRLALGKFPIDYSYLLKIKTIPYEKEGDLKLYQTDIDGHPAIIGDTHDLDDARTIPTEKVPVPGVYIHAAAFATMRLQMLRYITDWESRCFEFVLFVLAWAVMAFTHGRNPAHRPSRRWNLHSMEILSSALAAVVVLLVSTTFLWLTKLYWPDFLWIAAGFFLHPYLRHIKDLVVVPGLRGSVRHAGPA